MGNELSWQDETDLPTLRMETFEATWSQRPVDRHRKDEAYLAWDASIRAAAIHDYRPLFMRAHSAEEVQATSTAMSSWLVGVYYKAHGFGGVQHVNSPAEEISVWIRTLAAKCWLAPEQEVIALFLHPGESLIAEGITWYSITTERGRVLLRADLSSLTGKRVEDFTSEAVIEKAMIDEARDAEAAKHAPWESNFYTARNGRRLHLADVEGRRENDE